MSSAPRARRCVGITLALAAAVSFALANASASLAYHSGSNPLTVAAIRFVLPTAVLVVWLLLRGVPLGLPTRDGWVAAALGAVTAVYTWALLSAVGVIPLALAILVFYLFPLVATDRVSSSKNRHSPTNPWCCEPMITNRMLTLKLASKHRPGGPWSNDDYDVFDNLFCHACW